MNGGDLSRPAEAGKAALGAFADQLGARFAGIAGCDERPKDVALANLACSGTWKGADLPLTAYLARARRASLSSEEAFGSLVRSVLGEEDGARVLAQLGARTE